VPGGVAPAPSIFSLPWKAHYPRIEVAQAPGHSAAGAFNPRKEEVWLP